MKKILYLVILWLFFEFSIYYILPFFIKPLLCFFVCITLFALLIIQFVKILKERGKMAIYRLLGLGIILFLLTMTCYKYNEIPRYIIEKIDWYVLYSKRNAVVNEVLVGRLKPNSERNNDICHLPFYFPIVSNGGNDIYIYTNKRDSTKVIKF